MAFVHVQASDDSESAEDEEERHDEDPEEHEDPSAFGSSSSEPIVELSTPKETAAVLTKRFQQLLRAGRHSSGSRFQLAVHAGRMSDSAQRPALSSAQPSLQRPALSPASSAQSSPRSLVPSRRLAAVAAHRRQGVRLVHRAPPYRERPVRRQGMLSPGAAGPGSTRGEYWAFEYCRRRRHRAAS